MNRLLLRTKARLRDVAKPVAEAAVGALTVALLRTTRYFDPDKTANFFGRVTRFIGRRLREDRIGRENLTAAFPEKSPEEIETTAAREVEGDLRALGVCRTIQVEPSQCSARVKPVTPCL